MTLGHNLKHENFMRLAIEQAQLAEQLGEVPVGAVITYQDQVIATAHNLPINSLNPCSHAEIEVLKKAANQIQNYRLLNCDIYITLEPCMMCVGAMIHARINHCYFGAFDPKTGVAQSCDQLFNKPYHNHCVKYSGGILQADCENLLKNFFKKKRRKLTKNQ